LGAFHVSQQMGLSLGEVFNPSSEETTDAMRQFFRLLALVIFLTIGGHRVLIGSMLASFQSVPLTGFVAPSAIATLLAHLLTASFTLALKVAAPVLLAMLLASLAMGFVQRAMPQFHFLSTGAPVRVVLGLIVIASVLSLPVLMELLGRATDVLDSSLRTCMEARP
jgi:flagellar biosynthetic protein FliR